MRDKIRALITDAIKDRSIEGFTPEFSVAPPEIAAHGDYASNIALILGKMLKKNPMDVAEEIRNNFRHSEQSEESRKLTGSFVRPGRTLDDGGRGEDEEGWKIEVVRPGFLNFFISDTVLFRELEYILKNSETLGKSEVGKDKTVMVEYFQLNIAKRPHIGHIRSAIIGDALKRMLLSQGYDAVSDTHVGDWGTQFGILLLGYKTAGANLHERETIQDPFAELEEIYLAENARIKDDPARRETAKEEFAKLEQGNEENRKLWQWMVEVSMKNLEASAVRLGLLPFDEHKGESFYEDKMAPIVALALEKSIAQKKDDGAVVVDLNSEGLDEAVLIKSDGASTYLLRDLATIQYRQNQWHFWKNLYVVDVRQGHHFKQLFRVAELLGFEGVGASEHVSYGFIKTQEGGAISTRGGTGISLEKVIDEAVEKARGVIHEKNPDLKNADEVARMVGIGALKYFDLSHHRESDIVFTWERALSFDGNTGPYLQYTYARLKSILRKAGDNKPPSSGRHSEQSEESRELTGSLARARDNFVGLDPLEHALLVSLLRFPEAIEDALAIWSPHILAGYLYALAQSANEFYHTHPVLNEPDTEKKNLRLALVAAVAETLARGLFLLGIETPEEM